MAKKFEVCRALHQPEGVRSRNGFVRGEVFGLLPGRRNAVDGAVQNGLQISIKVPPTVASVTARLIEYYLSAIFD